MITVAQLRAATGSSTASAEKVLPYIIEAMEKYAINTPIRQLCFLAQVGHESGGLYYTEEIASGAAYEGRKNLGNTQKGDGIKFKGRGLIQITGRTNYGAVGTDFGIDLLKNPALLGGKNVGKCTPEQMRYAALSAGWFWNSRKLNDIADKIDINKPIDAGNNNDYFKLITKKINGGYNGLAERVAKYKSGSKYF
jgi:putative chitinase